MKIEKIDLLVSLYIFCIMVSELMGAKTFPILHWPFTLNASVAIFVLPVIYTINDIIIEVKGIERARSLVRSGLLVVFFTLLYSLLAVHLPPSTRFVSSEPAYDAVFGLSARISFASLTAFILAEFTDILVFQKLRKRLGTKALWLRSNASNVVSLFLDTVIFMSLAFWAFDKSVGANVTYLWSLILPYWLIKCCMSLIETPFLYLGVRWLKGKA